MRSLLPALTAAVLIWMHPAVAGEAEIRAAQTTIESQIRAFLADDDAAAYGSSACSRRWSSSWRW